MNATNKPDETSLATFAGWETLFDRVLKTVEVVVVLAITGLLFFMLGREVHWIWIASDLSERQQRIESALKMLHENWKVGLLILVPLFYRSMRMFLERVRKAFGIELQQPDEGVVKKPNPPLSKTEDDDDEDSEQA